MCSRASLPETPLCICTSNEPATSDFMNSKRSHRYRFESNWTWNEARRKPQKGYYSSVCCVDRSWKRFSSSVALSGLNGIRKNPERRRLRSTSSSEESSAIAD
jgi:hypothetical protein